MHTKFYNIVFLVFLFVSYLVAHDHVEYKFEQSSIIVNVWKEPAEGNIYTVSVGPDIKTNLGFVLSYDGKQVLYKNHDIVFFFDRLPNDKHVFGIRNTAKKKLYQFEWLLSDLDYTEINRVSSEHRINRHDFKLLQNGNILFSEFYFERLSRNKFIQHTVFKEQTPEGESVFTWNTDQLLPRKEIINNPCVKHLTKNSSLIDYVHSNSFWEDDDGHFLFSHRHLNEITKVHRETGKILWRLGGPYNDFTFFSQIKHKYPKKFSFQHCHSRLPNGNILLFDNGNHHEERISRIVEYKIDEKAKTATLIWQYSLHKFSAAMGSVQRLSNGNTFICYSTKKYSKMLEITPKKEKVLEITCPHLYLYRAFKR